MEDKKIEIISDTDRVQSTKENKHIQFSKIVVMLCIVNLFIIEFFSMYMIYSSGDTAQVSYLITSIAVECLAAVVWYMKNSETEKKARIQAEVDKAKLEAGIIDAGIEDTSDGEGVG